MTARYSEWGGAIPEVSNARRRWRERRGILLAIEAEGVTGFGEATPLPGYGGGSLEEVRRALADAPVEELARLGGRADVEAAIDTPLAAARFCLETALLDRLARSRELPLADLLAERHISQPVRRARFGGTLGDPQLVDSRPLKLKVTGADLDRERELLSALRAQQPDVELRLDLNGVLDSEQARRALDVYADFGIRWVEEPVAGRGLLELGETRVPWLADESLQDPTLADELVGSKSCAGVVLKPTLLGLSRARSLGVLALAAGKIVIVSHAFEGPVALAACAELALSLGLGEACGIDRHAALGAFPSCALPQLTEAQSILPVPRLGLGVAWH